MKHRGSEKSTCIRERETFIDLAMFDRDGTWSSGYLMNGLKWVSGWWITTSQMDSPIRWRHSTIRFVKKFPTQNGENRFIDWLSGKLRHRYLSFQPIAGDISILNGARLSVGTNLLLPPILNVNELAHAVLAHV